MVVDTSQNFVFLETLRATKCSIRSSEISNGCQRRFQTILAQHSPDMICVINEDSMVWC